VIIPKALYKEICRVMPIPCVDLLISDSKGRVLLIKRKKEPAAGQWWFPGGRVHFGETRAAAATRKLNEECGLEAISVEELGTYDVIFEAREVGVATHGITTVFHMPVRDSFVRLDAQSLTADWRTHREWQRAKLHPFVEKCLNLFPG